MSKIGEASKLIYYSDFIKEGRRKEIVGPLPTFKALRYDTYSGTPALL